jgi:hypothetical protein
VVVALTYLRRNRVQRELAETYGVSQSTISRAISTVTPLLARALARFVPVAEELVPGRQYLVDGTLLPCRHSGVGGAATGALCCKNPDGSEGVTCTWIASYPRDGRGDGGDPATLERRPGGHDLGLAGVAVHPVVVPVERRGPSNPAGGTTGPNLPG